MGFGTFLYHAMGTSGVGHRADVAGMNILYYKIYDQLVRAAVDVSSSDLSRAGLTDADLRQAEDTLRSPPGFPETFRTGQGRSLAAIK